MKRVLNVKRVLRVRARNERFDDAFVAQGFKAHEVPAAQKSERKWRSEADETMQWAWRALLAAGAVEVAPAERQRGELPAGSRE